MPVHEVEARVRPLITRDNEWTVLDRLPFFVVTAEVLDGLDIAPRFSFALRGGGTRDLTLQPISVAQHIRALRRLVAADDPAGPAAALPPASRASCTA